MDIGTEIQMKLIVRPSAINGWGVFADDDIRQGELIHRMGGRKVSLMRCILEIAKGTIRIDDPLSIQKYRYLVLDDLSILFNHCCHANASLTGEVDLIALADIPRGQEITFDYSMTVRPSLFTALWKMPCNCAVPTCRKAIGNVRSVTPQQLQRYLQAGALQDFILASLGIEDRGFPRTT
jgi:hypothetical protein